MGIIPDSVLPDGWIEYDHMAAVQCEHGHMIEYDGTCPDGCDAAEELGI